MTFGLTAPVQFKRTVEFSRNRTCRRTLRCSWAEPCLRWASWLMLNPSDADAERDDPTTVRVTKFTRAWGYDGWVIVNVYPFISSDPREIWARANWQANGPDWYSRDDLQANAADIEEVGRVSALRMVAFGTQPFERDEVWLEQCLERYQQPGEMSDGTLWCLGRTQGGAPIHPLARGKYRVPDSARPVVWRAS